MTGIEDALRAGPPDAGADDGRWLARRADAEGLVDVAVATVEGPLGRLLVAATAQGLVRVAFEEEGDDDVLDELARRLSPRVLEAPARLDAVRRQLDEYFGGRRQAFDLPVDWSLIAGFRRRVLEVTAAIPFGQVATYAEVAARAGRPKAWRAAGSAVGANPVPVVVPCHRVLRTGGGLGGYGGGLDKKVTLLRLEGVLATAPPGAGPRPPGPAGR